MNSKVGIQKYRRPTCPRCASEKIIHILVRNVYPHGGGLGSERYAYFCESWKCGVFFIDSVYRYDRRAMRRDAEKLAKELGMKLERI